MSGGFAFQHQQYQLLDMAESLNNIIKNNGSGNHDYENNEDNWDYHYTDEIIEQFKNTVKLLEETYIYCQRIDWLVSGDDSEKTFFKRLEEDLREWKENKKEL